MAWSIAYSDSSVALVFTYFESYIYGIFTEQNHLVWVEMETDRFCGETDLSFKVN